MSASCLERLVGLCRIALPGQNDPPGWQSTTWRGLRVCRIALRGRIHPPAARTPFGVGGAVWALPGAKSPSGDEITLRG